MKLVKQTQKGFQYELEGEDVESLRFLVNQFPIVAFSPAKVSKTDAGSSAMEREQLINDSLRLHREGLKRKARGLILREKLRSNPCISTWTAASRPSVEC